MAHRTYESDAVRVLWDSSLCIHSGICLRKGNGAFDTRRRPWVDLEAADTATVVAAIESCPSGALRYERLDGTEGEVPPVPTTIIPWPDGPLMVRGAIEVTDRAGNAFTASPRAALCRCGESGNQPFCDLSHREAGFTDNPLAPRPDDAAGPSDISDEPLA